METPHHPEHVAVHLPACDPAVVRSVQVGQPRTQGSDDAEHPMDRRWTSAIWKEPISGPIWCGTTNLTGDAQADLRVHGGPEKAVLAYAAEHYPAWRAELALPSLAAGAFGENLTVDGWTEQDVCIGDVVVLGGAVLQLSQPRGPCWKLARRWRIPDLALRVQQTGRTGWYLRVLQEGWIAPGQPLQLQERPCPEWTVARAIGVMYARPADPAEMLALAALPHLAPRWRRTLEQRGRTGVDADHRARLVGPNAE